MEQRPDSHLTDPDAQPPARIPPVVEQILRFITPYFICRALNERHRISTETKKRYK
jgi:hypothetical protein